MAVGKMYENVIRNNTDKRVIMTDKSTSVRNVLWVKGVGAGRWQTKGFGIFSYQENAIISYSIIPPNYRNAEILLKQYPYFIKNDWQTQLCI